MIHTPQFASFLGLETRVHTVKQQVRNVRKKIWIYNSYAYQMGDTMAHYDFEMACVTNRNHSSFAKVNLTNIITYQQLVYDHALHESY